MLQINLKGITKCSSMVANILPTETYPPTPQPPDTWDGDSRSKFNFSEHGRATYQFKENQECSNMVANIFPIEPYTPHPPYP